MFFLFYECLLSVHSVSVCNACDWVTNEACHHTVLWVCHVTMNVIGIHVKMWIDYYHNCQDYSTFCIYEYQLYKLLFLYFVITILMLFRGSSFIEEKETGAVFYLLKWFGTFLTIGICDLSGFTGKHFEPFQEKSIKLVKEILLCKVDM